MSVVQIQQHIDKDLITWIHGSRSEAVSGCCSMSGAGSSTHHCINTVDTRGDLPYIHTSVVCNITHHDFRVHEWLIKALGCRKFPLFFKSSFFENFDWFYFLTHCTFKAMINTNVKTTVMLGQMGRCLAWFSITTANRGDSSPGSVQR